MFEKMLALAVATATVLSVASTASAQSGAAGSVDVEKIAPTATNQGGPVTLNAYSVKFLCGTIPAEAARADYPAKGMEFLVPGTYLTAANIFNPNDSVRSGRPLPEIHVQTLYTSGATQSNTSFALPAFQEETFTCANFVSELVKEDVDPYSFLQSNFVLGYLTLFIQPGNEIDVVGVYTFKNVEVPPPGPTEPAG